MDLKLTGKVAIVGGASKGLGRACAQVLGEEGGSDGPDHAEHRWILDPIDGTKSFIHGVPLFGTLIALVEHGTPVIGVINLPATGEMMIGAKGRPTTVNGRPVRVRETSRLSEGTNVGRGI